MKYKTRTNIFATRVVYSRWSALSRDRAVRWFSPPVYGRPAKRRPLTHFEKGNGIAVKRDGVIVRARACKCNRVSKVIAHGSIKPYPSGRGGRRGAG